MKSTIIVCKVILLYDSFLLTLNLSYKEDFTMAFKKSEAYLKIQKQFKFVGTKPLAFTSLTCNYVANFENTVEEIYKLISIVKEGSTTGKNVAQEIKLLEVSVDNFYKKYVSNAKFKNHIDIWNEWQKIEDKLNNEIGIELEYAAPQVTNGLTSPVGKKSAAYLKFQKNFISSVGLNPTEYSFLSLNHVKRFEDKIDEIVTMLVNIEKYEKNGDDATQARKTAQALMNNFYTKYVKNSEFKNHIDIWNEFMKLEDRFNQLQINLVYAAPSINS